MLSLSVILFGILFGGATDTLAQKEVKKRPNILFVSIDDLGSNLGAYDNKHIVSPNIDL